MKKLILLSIILFTGIFVNAQPEDVKQMHENAKGFMRTGDFDNAILILTRAMQKSRDLEVEKDLVMSYYMKRDFSNALEGAKSLIDRDDVDVASYQIAGNV